MRLPYYVVLHCRPLKDRTMSTTLTIRLDEKLDRELARLAKALHRSKSDLVR
ncbi:MAG: hypothetical protein OHK0018_14880 [Erythrobacter tepidarius]